MLPTEQEFSSGPQNSPKCIRVKTVLSWCSQPPWRHHCERKLWAARSSSSATTAEPSPARTSPPHVCGALGALSTDTPREQHRTVTFCNPVSRAVLTVGEGCVAPCQYYRRRELPNLGLTYIRKDYMEDPTQKYKKIQGKIMNSISCHNKLLYSALPEEALLGCFQSPKEMGFLRDFLQPEQAAASLSRDSRKDTSVEHKLDAWKSRCIGDENISTM